MKSTKRFKKLITLAGVACFSLATLISPVATLTVEASEPAATVSPCADSIQWRFLEQNGKLYRRLFNYSTNSWIGQWEYVCDIPQA